MNVDDTFIAPTGPLARFPGREMRVIAVFNIGGARWVDAAPVHPLPTDLYWHSTYELGADARPWRCYPGDVSCVSGVDEGGVL
jgi:hypothetical protein